VPSATRTGARLALLLTLGAAALSAPASAGASLGFVGAPGSPYPVASPPTMLEVADLNRDGRSDVIFAAPFGAGALLASQLGQLSPVARSPFERMAGALWVTPADLNGDGIPDVVTAGNGEGGSEVLLGDGTGAWLPAPGRALELGAAAEPTSVTVADFNRDGHEDLAFALCGKGCGGKGEPRVAVFLGDGTGRFTEAPGSPVATGLSSTSTITSGDLNADGNPDVVVGGGEQIAVLLGDGHGGLAPAPGSPSASGAAEPVGDLAVADLDGNGTPDVVTANSEARTITVFLNDGQGELTPTGPPLPTGSSGAARSVTVADMNADGNPDLIVANEHTGTQHGDVSVLLGDGHGGFAPAGGSPFATEGEGVFARVGDFDGDGQPDIALANGSGDSISVLLNTNRAIAAPSPAELAFDRLDIGHASLPQTVTVTDTGNGFLRPGAARLVGTQAGDFTLLADGCAGRVLLVGQSCSLSITFHPHAGGTRAATLELPANVAGGSMTSEVAGTGLAVPRLGAVHLLPSRFAAKTPGRRSRPHGPPLGSSLLFTLSEAATVRVSVTHLQTGHRRGHACRVSGRGPRCTVTATFGHISVQLGAGARHVNFSGVLAGDVLSPGYYTATVDALNDESISSGPVRLHFTVVAFRPKPTPKPKPKSG
jgi:VCBS repeat protein